MEFSSDLLIVRKSYFSFFSRKLIFHIFIYKFDFYNIIEYLYIVIKYKNYQKNVEYNIHNILEIIIFLKYFGV